MLSGRVFCCPRLIALLSLMSVSAVHVPFQPAERKPAKPGRCWAGHCAASTSALHAACSCIAPMYSQVMLQPAFKH